jgi:hypothetical protein
MTSGQRHALKGLARKNSGESVSFVKMADARTLHDVPAAGVSGRAGAPGNQERIVYVYRWRLRS